VRAENEWRNDLLLGAFWERVAHDIDSVFAALPDTARAERIAARDAVYASARRRLVDSIAPLLHGYPADWATRLPLNNAVLLSRRVYAERLDYFDSVYVAEQHNLRQAIQRIIAAREAEPPPTP